MTENLMDFYAALAFVAAGKRITKKEWNDTTVYGEMRDGKLMLHWVKTPNESGWHDWIISDADMQGKDWVLL